MARSAAQGPPYLTRKIAVYALLEEEQLVQIELSADRILAARHRGVAVGASQNIIELRAGYRVIAWEK